jgi:hypothetical protein
MMKSLKLIGLSLLAVFALGAFAASAFAEEGFLPTPKTATLLGGESTLESTGGEKIVCKEADDATVTFKEKSDKTATATLHFLGCKSAGFEIHSEGAKSEEILVSVTFEVCLDPKNSEGKLLDEFGIAGTITGGNLKLLQTVTGLKVEIRGTALSAVLTTGEAKLFSVEFLGKAGKQTVTECLQGETKIKHTLESSFKGGAFLPDSQNVIGGLLQFPTAVKLEDS